MPSTDPAIVLLNDTINLADFTTIPTQARLTWAEAYQVWLEARQEMFFPPLADPMIVFIENDPEPFCISPHNWVIKLNLAAIPPSSILPDRVALWFKYAIVLHEINHYMHFPYDREESLKCTLAIYEVFKDLKGADVYTKTVLYSFLADLIVDTDLLQLFGEVVVWATRVWFQYTLIENPVPSALGLTRLRTFEKYWGVDLGVPKGDKDIEKYSDQLAIAFKTYTDYVELAKHCAEILRPLLIKEMVITKCGDGCQSLADMLQSGQGSSQQGQEGDQPTDEEGGNGNCDSGDDDNNNGDGDGGQGDQTQEQGKQRKKYVIPIDGKLGIEIPEDFLLQVKENPDKIKGRSYVQNENPDLAVATQDHELLATLPTMIDNIHDFGHVLRSLNFNIQGGEKEIHRLWFRGKAYGAIRYESHTIKPIGEMKNYPVEWTLEDPLDQLDVVKSYQNFPVLIPPFTQKWERTDGSYGKMNCGVRDLIVVIDSSGSMWYRPRAKKEKDRGPFYYAQIGGFALLHAALGRGAKFSVINFSSKILQSKWLSAKNPKDIRYAEDLVMYHQGGTTLVPGSCIEKRAKESNNLCHIDIISDSDIWNINENIPYLDRLAKQGHTLALFLVGRPKKHRLTSRYLQRLLEVCKVFHVVEDYQNLVGLVVDDVRNIY